MNSKMAEDETAHDTPVIGPKTKAKKGPARKAKRRQVAEAKGTLPSKATGQETGFSPKLLIGFLFIAAIIFLAYSFWGGGAKSTGTAASAGATDNTRVNVILLNDVRCGKDCDMSNLVTQLKQMFPQLSAKQYDIGSAEGAKIYQESRLNALPAVLFDDSVKSTKSYANIQRFLEPAGVYTSLRIGANWDIYCDPTDEHCQEAKCASRIACRPEIPGKLDIFVMSQCPYGIMALDSMKEVLDAFKGEINFTVQYIGEIDEKTKAPTSLHGQAEVDEDLREVCAQKYYGQDYKFMQYVWCRNKDIQSQSWEKCAMSAQIDAQRIKSCSGGNEGRDMLAQTIRLSQELNIMASPTFMANNKRVFNAVAPAEIQAGICGANPAFKGCEKNLTSSTPQANTGGQCGK
jgi:hypothetical protein